MTKKELISTAKPILFNTDMVRAILSGQKTVTRRLPSKRIRDKWDEYDEWANTVGKVDGIANVRHNEKSFYEQYPPYAIGDVLYVRETWRSVRFKKPATAIPADFTEVGYEYRADNYKFSDGHKVKWKPSIHMPKEAARIFLKVTSVRMERLQEIMCDPPGPHNQVVLEGCTYGCDFIATWNHTIPKKDVAIYGWDANPLVWVIEFEQMEVEV